MCGPLHPHPPRAFMACNGDTFIFDRLFGTVVSTSDCHPKGRRFDFRLYPRNFSGSIEFGTGSNQPHEENWVATWMRSSEIRLRKLKLKLRDKRFANHKAPVLPSGSNHFSWSWLFEAEAPWIFFFCSYLSRSAFRVGFTPLSAACRLCGRILPLMTVVGIHQFEKVIELWYIEITNKLQLILIHLFSDLFKLMDANNGQQREKSSAQSTSIWWWSNHSSESVPAYIT